MSAADRHACGVCGESVAGGPWILLNRWMLGTGTGRCGIEGRNDAGEYLWEFDPETSARDFVTGEPLHWPICATQWIEGQLIEATVELRRR